MSWQECPLRGPGTLPAEPRIIWTNPTKFPGGSLRVIVNGGHSCFHPLVSGLCVLPIVGKHLIGASTGVFKTAWRTAPRPCRVWPLSWRSAMSLKAVPVLHQPGNSSMIQQVSHLMNCIVMDPPHSFIYTVVCCVRSMQVYKSLCKCTGKTVSIHVSSVWAQTIYSSPFLLGHKRKYIQPMKWLKIMDLRPY